MELISVTIMIIDKFADTTLQRNSSLAEAASELFSNSSINSNTHAVVAKTEDGGALFGARNESSGDVLSKKKFLYLLFKILLN